MDLDNITSFIFSSETEDVVKSSIKETYENSEGEKDLKLKEKVLIEGKNGNLSNEQKIKSELIKWLLDTMDEIVVPEGTFELGDLSPETVSQKIALNTLYQYGFIN